MPTILYVFPHPDDESFGPAPVLARQRREEHAVHLLTLTKGEATSQRERLGFSKEKMGRVRRAEMQRVADVLDLSSLQVLDFEDGGLGEMDPRVLEGAVAARIREVQPAVVVTYATHGVSGHRDHLVSHAVVKRAFCQLRADGPAPLRRLALFTLPQDGSPGRAPHLTGSPDALIDCVEDFADEDLARAREGLDCYETYRPVIEEHRPLDNLGDGIRFELFQEAFSPPLTDLFAELP